MLSLISLLIRVLKKRSTKRGPAFAPRTKPISASPLSIGESYSAKVFQVIDGDTVDVRVQGCRVRVRLSSIDCPEDGQRWGGTAKAGLIKMIGGKSVSLEVHDLDVYGRTMTIATVFVQHGEESTWINVNERMVMLGHAWVMRAYYGHLSPERQGQLNRLEAWARSKKVGLWGTPDPTPPWEWRHEP
jgi:endonuclease YncB( thermonuclease family)